MSRLEQEMHDRQYPVDEDIALQRKVWRFQRVGWYVLLAIVILTLAGLFSRGPLSSLEVQSTQGDLTVSYERFHRSGGTNAMVVHAQGQPAKTVTLLISSARMEGFSIDSIQPQPVKSIGSPAGIALTMQVDESGMVTIYLAWRSDGLGLFKSNVGLSGGGQVSISQFIYP